MWTSWFRRFVWLAFGLTLAVAGAAHAADPGAATGGGATDVRREIPIYRLGPGDQVRVVVFGEDSLGGQFLVGGSGMVAFPLVGDVKAGGLTLAEFQDKLEQELKDGYLKDPKVSAEVVNYRPFYILGEVNKPGPYPYTNGLTVQNAVATAGGFTYRANTKRAFIKRDGANAEQEFRLTSDTPVAPGDTIRITERFF